MKKNFRILLILLLAALLLAGCGTAPAQESPAPESTLPEGAVEVGTVDEFLAALAPNTTVVLREGDYDLSAASDYGREGLRGVYHWELIYGGCELVIEDVDGLKIQGQGQVQILAKPRYAEVIRFNDCWGLTLEGLTLGHTEEPGICGAGVLRLQNCQDVRMNNCRLFGCGTMGVTAADCSSVFLDGCRIDSCSDGALLVDSTEDMRLTNCIIEDCGKSENAYCSDLISVQRCKGFALVNCQIQNSRCYQLLHNYYSDQVSMLGCRVEGVRCGNAMFLLEGRSLVIDKCSFQRRSTEKFYADTRRFAFGPNGEELLSFDLDHMEYAEASYDGPVETPRPSPSSGGGTEVSVSSVDQLLEAIAPDTVILLAPGDYDLSAAADYGRQGGTYYEWVDCYDGYYLEIHDISGLTIRGAGKDETRILAEPRYAAVFSFRSCEEISLEDLTAGHTPAPAYCTGNVVDLTDCTNVTISGCGLFGCGVVGISGRDSRDLNVLDTEIYECSWRGAEFENCEAVSFSGCSIHDCDDGNDQIFTRNSSVRWDGTSLSDGLHFFDHESYIGSTQADW